MGHPIDDMISAAGAQLAQAWKFGNNPQMPENDLNPSADKLAFRIKILEDKCAVLEKVLGEVVRHLKGQQR